MPLGNIINQMSSKNILTLSSASAVSQLITISGTLITARLFLPEDFGHLAFFFSLLTILSILGTLEFQRIISITKKNEDAFVAINLVAKLLIIFGLTLFMTLFILEDLISNLIKDKIVYKWLYLLPITLFASALFQTFSLLLNRFSLYKNLALSRIFFASLIVIFNIIFGYFSVKGGLIFGTTIGTFIAFLLILYTSYGLFGKKIFESNFSKEKKLSKVYKNHPKHLTPSVILGTSAEQIPIFIFFTLFDVQEAGFYAMATRVIYLPITLIANSIGEVYRQEIFDAFNEKGSFKDVHYRTLKKTFLIALCIPFLYPILPLAFEFFLGSKWIPAAEYSQILTISLFFQIIITPLDKSSLLVNATKYIFFWQFLRFILNIFLIFLVLIAEISATYYLYGLVITNISLYIIEALAQLYFANFVHKKEIFRP